MSLCFDELFEHSKTTTTRHHLEATINSPQAPSCVSLWSLRRLGKVDDDDDVDDEDEDEDNDEEVPHSGCAIDRWNVCDQAGRMLQGY